MIICVLLKVDDNEEIPEMGKDAKATDFYISHCDVCVYTSRLLVMKAWQGWVRMRRTLIQKRL